MPEYFEFTTQKGVTIIDMLHTHPSLFYNQDWYIGEEFANRPLDGKLHRISIAVSDVFRRIEPTKLPFFTHTLPSAGVYTYAFIAHWIGTGKFLWERDYTWTSDVDSNGDYIYVGGYGVNRAGFEIHRHLSLRECHSVALEVTHGA